MEQLKDNIPLSEDTEQEPVEYGPGNPFLDYFKVMTSDFRSPGQVFSDKKYAARAMFWEVVGWMAAYGPGNGPNGPIDYDALWEEIRKADRISSDAVSSRQKQRFIDLCKEFESKIKKSRGKLDQTIKRKLKTKKPNSTKQKSRDGGADPDQAANKPSESDSTPENEIPDDEIPDDVPKIPYFIEMYKKYKPLSMQEAKQFLGQVRDKKQNLKFFSELGWNEDRFKPVFRSFEYPTGDDFQNAYNDTSASISYEGAETTIISQQEQKLMLFLYCTDSWLQAFHVFTELNGYRIIDMYGDAYSAIPYILDPEESSFPLCARIKQNVYYDEQFNIWLKGHKPSEKDKMHQWLVETYGQNASDEE